MTFEKRLRNTPHDRVQYMNRTMRKLKNPEMFVGLTDDLVNMSSFQPTSEVKARFESVFDQSQREHLKIILHPLLKRWTLFERTVHKGQPLWHPVCMFQGEKKEGYLPPDLQRSDKMNDHLRGKIGDFRNVTYSDFEFVERCDYRKYGWESVLKFLEQFDDIEQKEQERIFNDQLDDFLDYHFWLAMRDAQDHYSQPWSTDTVELKTAPDRWHIEEKNGYTVRTRVWGEEGDMNEMKEAIKKHGKDYAAFDPTSPASKAVAMILARKNWKWKEKHGETLYEHLTGERVIWEDFDETAQKQENETQAEKLAEMAHDAPLPEQPHQTIDEWLKEVAREKDKVPV